MPYIYMVRCKDESLYTGITTDIRRRMQEHGGRKRSGAKYTKSHGLLALEMVWETDSWSHAAKLEYRIKRLTRKQKEALLLYPEQAGELMAGYPEGAVYVPRPDLKPAWSIEDQEGAKEHGETEAAAGFPDGA